MAEKAEAYLVSTMQMTREDKAMLKAGKLPMQAAWKFSRDVDEIEHAQKRIAYCKAEMPFYTKSEGLVSSWAMTSLPLRVSSATMSRRVRSHRCICAGLSGRREGLRSPPVRPSSGISSGNECLGS